MSTSLIETLPRPDVTPPRSWQAPAAQRITLPNGPVVIVHDLPGQHVAAIEIHLGIDLRTEPEGAEGIAAVMAASLSHGSMEDFTDRIAAYGATWTSDTDHTGPCLICQAPVTNLAPVLSLAGQAVQKPALHSSDVDQQIRALYAKITQTEADLAGRAMLKLAGAVFDPVTRAGRPAHGALPSLHGITPNGVAAFYRDRVRAANAVVSIAGDLADIDIEHLVTDAFGSWTPTGAATNIPGPAAPERSEPVALFVPHAEATQSYLLLAAPTLSRHDRDWPALATATAILGAPYIGRLDAQLREELGYSYSTTAVVRPLRPNRGVFIAGGAIAANATPSAIDALFDILDTAIEDGFSDAECKTACDGLRYSLPMLFQDAPTVAAHARELITHGLEADFTAHAFTAIGDLSPDQINNAFRRHVDPRRLSLIAVAHPDLRDPLGEYLPNHLRLITT